MKLMVYNTLTKEKEEFIPLEEGKVRMYVCGVTVYDYCHIGHARSAVVFDVIYRYLLFLGYDVTYVRNFTDIDDKIIKRAQEEGTDYKTIADRYIKAFYEDMDRLGILRPTLEPKATEHIQDMIEIIKKLFEKGYAYKAGRDVYFAVDHFPGYGKLSGRSLEDMIAGARVEVDEHKKNPFDFVLWKGSKEGEPAWDSPWGPGRPGWHIECSAMSAKLLGETFDIHGGGKDLIFPHHENEIAQSEGAFGKTFVRYWLHNGFVNINNEKMSKSLGNFFTIREILEKVHPEVLRLFVLSKHYRSPVDFSDEALKESEKGLERLYMTISDAMERLGETKQLEPNRKILLDLEAITSLRHSKNYETLDAELWEKTFSFPERFLEAMNNDFNTAQAIGLIFDLRNALQRFLEVSGRKKLKGPSEELVSFAVAFLKEAGSILGVIEQPPEEFFRQQNLLKLKTTGMTVEELESWIAKRAEARREKRFEEADQIRAMLSEKSIQLEDTPQGTRWRVV
ncbi:MAG: cysteine--tRNA ligase [Syntrophobacterales bacterium]|nr:cysteine--tRNA ligase [Syntrophobacterales bacterium]